MLHWPAEGGREERQIFLNIADSAAGSGSYPDRDRLTMWAQRGRVYMWSKEAKEALSCPRQTGRLHFHRCSFCTRAVCGGFGGDKYEGGFTIGTFGALGRSGCFSFTSGFLGFWRQPGHGGDKSIKAIAVWFGQTPELMKSFCGDSIFFLPLVNSPQGYTICQEED